MALVSFETLLPDLIPMVPGAPDTLIVRQVRSAVVEFCEKSEVYNEDIAQVTTIPDIYDYELAVPKYTTCHRIMQVAFKGVDLEPISTLLLDQRRPDWRNKNGNPEYYVKQRSNSIWLVPIPNKLEPLSTHVRACLKPTHDAQGIEEWMMNDYRDSFVNGALYRLLRQPAKAWSDIRIGAMYGGLFQEGIANARLVSRQADSRVARKVRYAGTADRSKFRRGYGSNN